MIAPAQQISLLARLEPNRPAIVAGDSIVSYGMLDRAIASLAARVDRLGLAPGATVAVAMAAPTRLVALGIALEQRGFTVGAFSSAEALAAMPNVAVALTDRPMNLPDGRAAVVVDDGWFAPAAPTPASTPPPPGGRLFVVSRADAGPDVVSLSHDEMTGAVAGYGAALGLMGPSRRLLSLRGLTGLSGVASALATLAAGATLYLPTQGQDPMQLALVYGCDALDCSGEQLAGLAGRQKQRLVIPPTLGAAHVAADLPADAVAPARSLVARHLLRSFGTMRLPVAALRIEGGVPAAGTPATWSPAHGLEAAALGVDGAALPAGTPGALAFRSIGHTGPWQPSGRAGVVVADGQLMLLGDANTNAGGRP